MTFILTVSGVVLTLTLLRLLGNEREHVQRRRDAEEEIKAREAAMAAAEAALMQPPAPQPAAKGQAPKAPAAPAKPAAPVNAPAKKAA